MRRVALALVLAASLGGCTSEPGAQVQTYWGPTENGSFEPGGSMAARGLVHRFTTRPVPGDDDDSAGDDDDSAGNGERPARDLLELVLIDSGVSCEDYAQWLASVGAIQDVVDARIAAGDPNTTVPWICSELLALGQQLFGEDGRYRALHLLLEVTDGMAPPDGVFRPAPVASGSEFAGTEALRPGTFVSRLYERSRHAEDLGPPAFGGSADDLDPIENCSAAANALLQEFVEGRQTYPDRAGIVLQSATHRWYHRSSELETILLGGQQSEISVGVTLPDWDTVAEVGASASLAVFGGVSRAPEDWPYAEVLLGTQEGDISLEPCPDLDASTGVVWSELGGLEAGSYGQEPSDSCSDSVHPACWPVGPSLSCSSAGATVVGWLALLLTTLTIRLRSRREARDPSAP